MSERRNFPANSKDVAKKDNVDRGTVDSFAFMLDYLSLKIDDNLRIVKVFPIITMIMYLCLTELQVRPRYNVISGGWEKLCYSEVYVIVSWAHQYAICMSK